MGRMAVEPGSAPHWIGNEGRRRNRWGRGYNNRRNKNYMTDIRQENSVKEEVEQVLLEKIENNDSFTDEQKAKIKNTIKAQVGLLSTVIIEQAEDDVDQDFEDEMNRYADAVEESRDTRAVTQRYYEELRERAVDIAINEYNIDEEFDIDAAITREAEIIQKINEGEITKAEGRQLLEEGPLLYEGTSKEIADYVKTYIQQKREQKEEQKSQEAKTNDGDER